MGYLDWSVTLSLVFGGCCSNVLALERLTSDHPDVGSLLTFVQFLFITLHGLPAHVIIPTEGRAVLPRLKQRQIPIKTYFAQVLLYSLASLLNNAALSYSVPMPVHIIFRSGGLVVSMLLGYVLLHRRYSGLQVCSVFIVTSGILLTTLSASPRSTLKFGSSKTSATYLTGIAMLSIALLLSGLLGVIQEQAYAAHRRRQHVPREAGPWKESMFYLHFLSLPLFLPFFSSLKRQFNELLRSPPSKIHLRIPYSIKSLGVPALGTSITLNPSATLTFPHAPLLLVLNAGAQLLCAAGANRLTTRVDAVTVTLILSVRKAVSLLLSAALAPDANRVDARTMWLGAALVLLGTIGYTIGARQQSTHVATSPISNEGKSKTD